MEPTQSSDGPPSYLNAVAYGRRSDHTVRHANSTSEPSRPAEQPQPHSYSASSSLTDRVDTDSNPLPSCPPPVAQPQWRLWILELAAILFSLASFIVIVAVLSVYDERSLPDWPWGITLNSFLAFFTLLAQAGFMLPVSTAISQTKWTWFLAERPLSDFQLFSQASSGIWGPLALLWKIQHRHFISLGAFLMIISTLTSPITQLAIGYPLRNATTSGEAQTWAIRNINATDDVYSAAMLGMTLATALDNTGYASPLAPSGVSCSTGNCTFDQSKSLGVCVKMANITSHLQVDEIARVNLSQPYLQNFMTISLVAGKKTWSVSLPGLRPVFHQNNLLLTTNALNGSRSIAFQNDTDLLRTRIISLVSIYTTPIVPKDFKLDNTTTEVEQVLTMGGGFLHEAQEILFHFCVQSFDSKVEKGVEKTNLVSSHYKPVVQTNETYLDMNCTASMYNTVTGCWFHRKDPSRLYLPASANDSRIIQEIPENEIYSVGYASMGNIGERIQSKLSGSWVMRYAGNFSESQLYSTDGDFLLDLADILFTSQNLRKLSERHVKFTNIFNNVGTSISSLLRNKDKDFMKNSFTIRGQAWNMESYVHITWEWISFIAVEFVLATGLLALTMVTESGISRKNDHTVIRGLKDSSLATLVVLGNEARIMAGGGLGSNHELEKAAREILVKLKGNRLVPVQEMSKSRAPAWI